MRLSLRVRILQILLFCCSNTFVTCCREIKGYFVDERDAKNGITHEPQRGASAINSSLNHVNLENGEITQWKMTGRYNRPVLFTVRTPCFPTFPILPKEQRFYIQVYISFSSILLIYFDTQLEPGGSKEIKKSQIWFDSCFRNSRTLVALLPWEIEEPRPRETNCDFASQYYTYYVLQVNLNNVMRYTPHANLKIIATCVSQPDNMVSPAGRAAGSAIDSRKDIARQPRDNRKLWHELW